MKAAAAKLVGQGSKSQIHSWVVIGSEAQPEAYRSKLSGILPDYMLPNRIHILDQMPYTPNGKIDYPKLINSGHVIEKSAAREPVGRLEKSILKIWKNALEQPNLTVLDNFFESGGDSLSAVITLHEIEKLLGKRLSLHQLVENATVSSLAECVEAELNLPQLLVSLGDTTRKVSMYICASGNGDMLRFKALAKEMYGVCDLHMLQPPEIKQALK
ncbi:phosphopantetheine-binding protein [Psychrosphaera algicola]|uniref:Phosphopantetheine-binding protein n=1 Tax=Psychrosphaera algicola TaxID=3023714 RepID=A0ABT5FHK2_9GAMM|nr:phosphopantetheine-binding protein [Psychrosphaera sp. G1-22]MDC2890681.1 phosphopantetheine-binding protein [Psychrosphaera sp. G1-22]